MEFSNEPKTRPIRIYGDKDFYVYEGGKKKKLKTAKAKKKDVQVEYLNKITGKINPKSYIDYAERPLYSKIKTEPLQHASSIKRVEDLDEYLIALRKNNPTEYRKYLEGKALDKRELTTEEKNALNVLESRKQEEKAAEAKQEIKQEIKTTADEIKAQNTEIKTQNEELAAERKLLLEQKERDDEILQIFDDNKINSANFPVRSWNGLNHKLVVEAAIRNQLRPLIRNLARMTPYELLTMLNNARFSIPLNNRETPPFDRNGNPTFTFTRAQLDSVNARDDEKTRTDKEKLREKRKLIIEKFLSFLTPRSFNVLIQQLGNNYFQALGLTSIAKLPNLRQIGTGKRLPALWSDEIEDFFEDDKKFPHFGGVISADQINLLPKKLPIGFIMNLDTSDMDGSHWIAVYINGDSVEYFDPLADPPTESFKRDIKKYLEDMKVPILMKFKVNKIKQQSDSTPHCGFFAIKFLTDRFDGIPYPWTTRYVTNVKKGEEELKKEFDYI
jgi:hypothetical protein